MSRSRMLFSAKKIVSSPNRMVFGLFIILAALLVYIPFSPLRVAANEAFSSNQNERLGSPGWQPDARAFLFNVPFHRQEHTLSCEVASLRSALLGVGVDVSEWNLWLALPKDYTEKSIEDDQIIWGDPQKGFVGNVDGRMPETGYGVFIDPIESLAGDYATTSRVQVNHPEEIDAALREKRPIVVWLTLGNRPSIITWNTESGKQIQAPIHEHTSVIVGYRGSADFIEGLYLIDPLTSIRYMSWSEFQYRTSFFGHVGLAIGRK